MAFEFDKAFNKFAKAGTSLNRKVNQVIGKDVFQDIREIEKPREFPPYSSVPAYEVPEPEPWTPFTGEKKEFALDGAVITVSANLDACLQYRAGFQTLAAYYANRFAFKYQACAQEYDALIYYFQDMYLEGLTPMLGRAYSLLLPFGVFGADLESFSRYHTSTYQKAIASYGTLVGIEAAKNQTAQQTGEMVGGAVRLRGGGFGFKGAMKGMAKAELFNAGMGLVGKYVESQTKMTQEEKAKLFARFQPEVFFQEVYSDYFNSFLTMAQTLSDNNELDGVATIPGAEYQTMLQNLRNPMFPQDKAATALAKLISTYPFEPATFDLLRQKVGETEEVKQIVAYFTR